MLHSFGGALRQRSGLLLERQAAGHTYAFSSSTFACLLVLCRAGIPCW